MGLPQYKAMEEEWRLRPPTNRLVGWYLGYEAPNPQEVEQDDGSVEGLLEWAQSLGVPVFRG
jgi:hypothetical protein